MTKYFTFIALNLLLTVGPAWTSEPTVQALVKDVKISEKNTPEATNRRYQLIATVDYDSSLTNEVQLHFDVLSSSGSDAFSTLFTSQKYSEICAAPKQIESKNKYLHQIVCTFYIDSKKFGGGSFQVQNVRLSYTLKNIANAYFIQGSSFAESLPVEVPGKPLLDTTKIIIKDARLKPITSRLNLTTTGTLEVETTENPNDFFSVLQIDWASKNGNGLVYQISFELFKAVASKPNHYITTMNVRAVDFGNDLAKNRDFTTTLLLMIQSKVSKKLVSKRLALKFAIPEESPAQINTASLDQATVVQNQKSFILNLNVTSSSKPNYIIGDLYRLPDTKITTFNQLNLKTTYFNASSNNYDLKVNLPNKSLLPLGSYYITNITLTNDSGATSLPYPQQLHFNVVEPTAETKTSAEVTSVKTVKPSTGDAAKTPSKAKSLNK